MYFILNKTRKDVETHQGSGHQKELNIYYSNVTK